MVMAKAVQFCTQLRERVEVRENAGPFDFDQGKLSGACVVTFDYTRAEARG
jgi:hypothetical protein